MHTYTREPDTNEMRENISARDIETRRLDLVTISILVIIPLVCIIVFMLPVETQRTLQVYTTTFSPVNFITAIFVHGNLQHLVGNVVVFILVGCLTYFLNKKAKRDRFLLISLLTILFVLPLIYYPIAPEPSNFSLGTSFFWLIIDS